jgi:hypothetical protein
MAFVDVIDKDGNILNVNRDKAIIMYKVNPEEIVNMDDSKY